MKIINMKEYKDVIRDYRIPDYIIQDTNKRIDDWIKSGGKEDDPYIFQQFRYIENYINVKVKNKI